MNRIPDMAARNRRKLLMNARRQSGTDCLVWVGQVSNAGYGRLMLKTTDGNKMLSAPRAAYQLFVGPLQKDEIVVQRCRNRLCVNPKHLEAVRHVPVNYWHDR